MYSTDEFDPTAEGSIRELVAAWKRQAEAVGYVTTMGAVPPEPTCETCRHRLHLTPDWRVELDWCLRRGPAFPVTRQGCCPYHGRRNQRQVSL
jgi:hypothetical protein